MRRQIDEDEKVALKIELKPNERLLLGDCVLTNSGQRTRLMIDGSLPVLREKDIMSLSKANSPAKRIYLAVQFMYLSKNPKDNYTIYAQLARAMVKAYPGTKSPIERINNRILTGDLYTALKEARKLIAYEKDHPEMNHAARAYARVQKETASPRELEASLLLKAAAKLQAVQESWNGKKPSGLDEALVYNRRLWTVLIDAVIRDDNMLPATVRDNLKKLGMFVMGETFAMTTQPKPKHLNSLIKINRGIAAGLRTRA
jgi:flagellar biosynthesis repressor protein FlbT